MNIVFRLIVVTALAAACTTHEPSGSPSVSVDEDHLVGRYAGQWTNAEGFSAWGELTIQSVSLGNHIEARYVVRGGLNPTEDVCAGEQLVTGQIRDGVVTLSPPSGTRCTRTFSLRVTHTGLVGTSTRPSRRGGESQVVFHKLQ